MSHVIHSLLATLGLASPLPATVAPGGGAASSAPSAPPAQSAPSPTVDTTGATTGASAFVGAPAGLVHVRLLALNDFHGQISDSTATLGGDAVGGAATLATYMQRERAGSPTGTVTLSVGDAMGASEPASTLLRHESTIAVLAALGIDLATFGNHEFDKGYDETLRLLLGIQPPKAHVAAKPETAAVRKKRTTVRARAAHAAAIRHAGAVPAKGGGAAGAKASAAAGAAAANNDWPGSPFPWVSANVVDSKTGKPILPPYAIMMINGVKVAFIGADTGNLKKVTMASGIKNLTALDPATAINKYVPEIQAQGVHSIVVFVHEGGELDAKTGKVVGPIVPLVEHLDKDIDVVLSAHSHQEYATRIAGKVVTQGLSYAKAFSEVDMTIDPKTDDVVASSGKVIHNLEKGAAPDPQVAAMVGSFEQAVAPKTERVVSELPGPVTRKASPAGETALGTLIAESQRDQAKTEIGFMNPGGIRQDILQGGPVKWGTLFGVQPFANRVQRVSMTGAQVTALLEQQFHTDGSEPTILQVAGLRVTVDVSKPIGRRVVKVTTEDGTPLDPKRDYSVAVSNFLLDGGDGFTVFKQVEKGAKDVGVDLDALVAYLAAGKPVPLQPTGRLQVIGGKISDD